jgi:hypothetical protein
MAGTAFAAGQIRGIGSARLDVVDALAEAVKASLAGGAGGISLCSAGAMKEAHWEQLGRLTAG